MNKPIPGHVLMDGVDIAIREGEVLPVKLFDVTQVVGSVYSGGEVSPRTAAFMLIAQSSLNNDPTCTFTFPAGDGSVVSVTVENQVKE